MKKTIWGHTLIKNEDKFLWFALKSVIDFLDKILIWDTGSTDCSIEIIKLLKQEYPSKIVFKEIGPVDAKGITKARQQMLDQTKSDWVLILDGDEVWWKDSIEKVVKTINDKKNLNALVVPTINVVGDIYHYQEEAAGRYQFLNKKGHMNLRLLNRKIPGLHLKGVYPLEGYYDDSQKLLQNFNDGSVQFVEAPILHLTHLRRSSIIGDKKTLQRYKKLKYELGIPFSKDFKYPEVFYLDRPKVVLSPWVKMNMNYLIKALLLTPLIKIKRKLLDG